MNFNKHINIYTENFDAFIKEDKKIKLLETIEAYVTIKKNVIKIEDSQKYDKNEKKDIICMMIDDLNKVKKIILF